MATIGVETSENETNRASKGPFPVEKGTAFTRPLTLHYGPVVSEELFGGSLDAVMRLVREQLGPRFI